MTPEEVLDWKLEENDAGAKTVREYLVALARQVWIEEEGFSGKRPFGNSGWQWDVLGVLPGNNQEARALVLQAIDALDVPEPQPLPKYIILEDTIRSFVLRRGSSGRASSDAVVYHVYIACNSAADAERTIKALDAYE